MNKKQPLISNLEKINIILFLLLLSVFIWFSDALIDSLFFYNEGFWETGITNVQMFEVYFRLSIISVMLIGGFIFYNRLKDKRRLNANIDFERKQLIDIFNTIDEPVYIIDPKTKQF